MTHPNSRTAHLARAGARWLGLMAVLTAPVWAAGVACSSPKPTATDDSATAAAPATAAPATAAGEIAPTPAETDADAPATASDTAPPKRVAGLDKETREQLKKEYRELALKNDCSGRFPKLDGTWAFAGETKTPEYKEIMTIAGTRLTSHMTGKPDGKAVDAHITGEIRCLFKNRMLMQLDKVVPEGAFDNHSGDSFPCDLLGDVANTGNRMMMICYFDWDVRTAGGWEFEYERVDPTTHEPVTD